MSKRSRLARTGLVILTAFVIGALFAAVAIPAQTPAIDSARAEWTRIVDSLTLDATKNPAGGSLQRLLRMQDSVSKAIKHHKSRVDSISRILWVIPLRIASGLYDQDPGGYPRSLIPQSDRWSAVHAGGGCGTGLLVSALGGSWREAVIITAIASLAHEVAQGYVDPGDTVAELAGGMLCFAGREAFT